MYSRNNSIHFIDKLVSELSENYCNEQNCSHYHDQNKSFSLPHVKHNYNLLSAENDYQKSNSNKHHCFDFDLKMCETFSINNDVSFVNKHEKSSSKHDGKPQCYLYKYPRFTSCEEEEHCHNCRALCTDHVCEEKLINNVIKKLKSDFNLTPKEHSNVYSLSTKISKDTKGVYVFVPLLNNDPEHLSKQLNKIYKSILFNNSEIEIDKHEKKMGFRKLLNKYSVQKTKCVKAEQKPNFKSRLEKFFNSVIGSSPDESNSLSLRKFEGRLKNVMGKFGDHRSDQRTTLPFRDKINVRSGYNECKDIAGENDRLESYLKNVVDKFGDHRNNRKTMLPSKDKRNVRISCGECKVALDEHDMFEGHSKKVMNNFSDHINDRKAMLPSKDKINVRPAYGKCKDLAGETNMFS